MLYLCSFNRMFFIGLALLGFSIFSANAAIVTSGDTSLGVGTFGDVTTGITKVGAIYSSNSNLSGTLEVNGGSILTSKGPPTPDQGTIEPEPGGMIGRGSGSVGTVTVTGTDSRWRLEGTGQDYEGTPDEITFGPYLLVGRDGGRGELNITAGGKVILDGQGADLGSDFSGNIQIGRNNASGSNIGAGGSVLNIDGIGSEARIDNIDHTWFVMGKADDAATVNITNGGALNILGDNSLVTLRNGTANINSGGSVETQIFNVASTANSSATVNLDGATTRVHVTGGGTLDNEYELEDWGGWLTIGGPSGSTGVINMTNGAQINIDTGTGFAADGSIIEGSGFGLGGNSAIGFGGTGTLNVESGSLVTVSGGEKWVAIGNGNGSGIVNVNSGGQVIIENTGLSSVNMATNVDSGTSILNVDGLTSLFDGGGTLYVGVDGALANTAKADINLSNGGTVKANNIAVGSGGTIAGTGTLDGNVILNNGTIAIGNSPGTINIDGNFEMIDGILEIEVAGLGAGDFDVLSITGSADLTGGSIVFSFIDDFLPETGDSFLFLEALGGLNIVDNFDFAYKGVQDTFRMEIAGGVNGLGFLALNDASAVPVPAAVWLFGTALLGLFGFGKRRKAA
ncbi:MAG: hypothetical protein GY875_02110 [Gammaproteobacteria bacterium]|nr:hypothetical protein [Gammaproteobacteria bacterium]